MTPLIRRGSAKAKHLARSTWLKDHPEYFVDVPGLNDDVTTSGRFALDALVLKMRALDLFGSSTPDTQRETVRRLVSELRGESVGEGW